ncbi:hypothetical protein OTB20_18865 [Streptomyces sp. H27-H1]|uniref:hypothetical protein n=1 Tax=Streptomyces sp. H27-H1 TaxID=2996461 RepID=UPI00226FC0C1|nr:hypothetical protein [Streptomyces sp. H27-H1]MCY0928220.1 hypothetical protein [Streptomyces sp. H27-H1]
MTPAEHRRALAPLPDHRGTGDPAWQQVWANYAYLITPLRERGMVCDVQQGLQYWLVYAYPPGHDSVLIIGPEDSGWLVTHQAPAEDWTDFAVVYDSRAGSTPPAGPDAGHGREIGPLLAAVDARVARLPRVPAAPVSTVPRHVGAAAVQTTHGR